MTLGTTRPGLDAALLSPYVPIGYTASGLPVFGARGARSGSRVDFIVDDRADDDGDPFDDDDDDEDDDEDEETPASMRGKRPPPRRKTQRRARDVEDEADDDGEGDEDDSESGEQDDDSPLDRAAYKRMEEALARANKDQRNRRWVGKTMRGLGINTPEDFTAFLLDRGIDPSTGGRLDADDDADHDAAEGDDEVDEDRGTRKPAKATAEALKRAELRATSRVEEQFKPAMSAFAAEAALMALGFRRDKLKSLPRALRLIDYDAVDVEFDDKTGDPVLYGLEEQLKSIQEDFPEWFDQRRDGDEDEEPRPRMRRRQGGARQIGGGDRPKPKPAVKGWLQQLDEQIVRGSSR